MKLIVDRPHYIHGKYVPNGVLRKESGWIRACIGDGKNCPKCIFKEWCDAPSRKGLK